MRTFYSAVSKKFITILWLSTLALPTMTWQTAARAATPSATVDSRVGDSRVTELQEKYEQRISSRLRVFLPVDTKFDVSVRLKPVEDAEDPKTASAKKAAKKSSTFDIGYLSVPVSDDFLKGLNQVVPGARSPANDEPAIKSADVSVLIPKNDEPGRQDTPETEKKNIAAITELVKSLFEKIPTSVRVEYLAKLPTPPTPPSPPFDLQKNLPYLFGLLAAFMISFGVYAISRSLRSASVSLVNGLLNLNSRVKSEEIQKDDPNAKPVERKNEPDVAGKLKIQGGSLGTIHAVPNPDPHSVKVIREFIVENPLLVGRTISDSIVDMIGLRHLLPYLEDKERTILNQVLGQARLQRMWDIALDDEIQNEHNYDFNGWLHRVSEKLAIRKLQGNSTLDQAIGADRMLKFIGAESKKLFEVALKLNQRAAWRIALEFFPKEYVADFLRKMSFTELELVLGAALSSTDEITKVADSMIQELERDLNRNKTSDLSESSEERRYYYSKHIIDPLVSMISEKPVVEDELFLRRIDSLSSELGELVRGRVWSPERLKDVPDLILDKRIKALTVNERAALIMVLPKEQSERIRAMIPEGNGRSIVLDLVKQALAKPDAERDRKNLQFCRSFMESLKAEFDQKKFEIKGADNAPKAAA